MAVCEECHATGQSDGSTLFPRALNTSASYCRVRSSDGSVSKVRLITIDVGALVTVIVMMSCRATLIGFLARILVVPFACAMMIPSVYSSATSDFPFAIPFRAYSALSCIICSGDT